MSTKWSKYMATCFRVTFGVNTHFYFHLEITFPHSQLPCSIIVFHHTIHTEGLLQEIGRREGSGKAWIKVRKLSLLHFAG